jgi:hypothetical protein
LGAVGNRSLGVGENRMCVKHSASDMPWRS